MLAIVLFMASVVIWIPLQRIFLLLMKSLKLRMRSYLLRWRRPLFCLLKKRKVTVLTGEAKASELPYETVTEYGVYINSEALAEMGIALPADIASIAIEANAQ